MKNKTAVMLAIAVAFQAAGADAADPANGRKLFMSVGCYGCHGTAGQGATPTGPRLAPNPLPIEAILKELRSPRNVMPPYAASVLPDDAVADIRAFLTTIPPPPPRKP